MEPRMQYARTSDGVRIGYFSLGSGPPIVFGSNAWGDAHFYRELHPHTRRMTDTLVELGWRVIRYDLRGTGSSQRKITDIGADALQLDLEAVVDRLGLQTFALGGLHGGACTAVRYAAEHPEKVSSLVLLNPFLSGAKRFGENSVGRALSAVSSMAEDDWEFFILLAGNLVTKFGNPEHARALAATFQRSTSATTHTAYMQTLLSLDLTPYLPLAKAPTLVIHDTAFPFGTFEDCQEVSDAMPNARLLVITGDAAAEIAAVDAFLRESHLEPGTAAGVERRYGVVPLTPREYEILRLIARGGTNREISAGLTLSERTVARHITNIYDKLGLRSKAEATAYAIHNDLG